MFCSKCGAEIADDSVFCRMCGNKLTYSENQTPLQKMDFLLTNEKYKDDAFVLISGERYGTTKKRKILENFLNEGIISELENIEYYKMYIEPYMYPDYTIPNISFEDESSNINIVAKCPRCSSTSITTTNKKISATKGVAGAAVGSLINPVGTVVGAAVGATHSKKIYNVCMNCGHKWKP